MSVPGLYHHVRTREELLAIAAAHGLSELPLPEDHGQPWTTWLAEYARFVYDALVTQPEIIGQIVAGTIDTIRMAQHIERFFTVLAKHGFTVEEADAAYLQLTSAIIGAAVSEVGRRAMEAEGHAATRRPPPRHGRARPRDRSPRHRARECDATPRARPLRRDPSGDHRHPARPLTVHGSSAHHAGAL